MVFGKTTNLLVNWPNQFKEKKAIKWVLGAGIRLERAAIDQLQIWADRGGEFYC